MTDWVRALAVSFARRLVQEAEMQENAQELINRMCASPLVIRYEDGDELIHTDEHPFCDDPACGCHHNIDLLKEQVFEPFFNGLLTAPEAHRFMEGKQL